MLAVKSDSYKAERRGAMGNRLAAALACLLLLAGCLPTQAQPAASTPAAPKAPPADFYYARSRLDAREQAAYDQLSQALEAWQVGELALEAPLTGPQAAKVWEAVLRDRPEFYWAGAGEQLQAREQVARLSIALREDLELSAAQSRQEEIDRAADRLLEGIAGPPVEVACQVHDALLEWIVYQESLHQADAGTLYGGLVEGVGVCDAYSRSYQYLMQKMGVPCYTVVGQNRIRGASHSWNAVRLADGWYYVDTTWDDLPPQRGELFHDYLLLTFEEMEREHLEAPPAYGGGPPADSGRYNYYRYYGYSVDLAGEGDWLAGMAEAFTRQLQLRQDRLTQRPEPVLLEIKLFGDADQFSRCQEQFEEALFPLLEQIARQLKAQDLPISIETTGQVFYSCNPVTRVLTLRPRASLN